MEEVQLLRQVFAGRKLRSITEMMSMDYNKTLHILKAMAASF